MAGTGARARDGGRGGEDDGGGASGGVPVVLVVCYGVTTIKDCYYTAFGAMRGVGEGYFCTVPTLHRRRRWIGSRGRVQLVRLEGGGRVPGGEAGGRAGGAIPPSRLRG